MQLLADHSNGMADRRGTVVNWRHSWSVVRVAVVSHLQAQTTAK